MGIPQGGPAEGFRHRHILQAAGQEYHIGRFHSDVGASPNGYAHVCGDQSGGVVDAIAHHDHLVSLRLEGLYAPGFFRWEHIGNHVAYARFCCNGLGSSFIISREHDHVKPQLPQPADSGRGIRLQHIGGGNDSQEHAASCKVQGRFSLGGQLGIGGDMDSGLLHHLPVACQASPALDGAGDAPAWHSFKICRRGH